MGYEGRTASSTVPDEAVPRIRAAGGHVRPGSKPRAATEEQLPRRRPDAPEVPGEIVPVEAEPPAPETGNGQAAATTAPVEVPEADVEVGAEPPVQPSVPRAIRVARGATPQDLADRLG